MTDEPIELPRLTIGELNIRSACPSCGTVETRTAYDIGSGPELSCSSCEWCWGANGQPLEPLRFDGPGLNEFRLRIT